MSGYKNTYNKGLIFGEVSATKGATNAKTFSQIYGVPSSRAEAIKIIYNEKKFKIWWYLIFLTACALCLVFIPGCYLNCIEVVVCMISIDLVGRAKLLGQIVAIVECFLFAYISYVNKLYGEVIKSLAISLPLVIFALVSWIKNIKSQSSSDGATPKVRKLSAKGWFICGVSFAGVAVAGYFLLGLLGTSALLLSAICFSISLISKILNAFCYKEMWVLTIAQGVISFCLWTYTLIESILSNNVNLVNLPIMILYIAIISNAIYAYILWKAMYRKATVNGVEIFARRPIKINKIAKLKKRYKSLVWNKEIDVSKNS